MDLSITNSPAGRLGGGKFWASIARFTSSVVIHPAHGRFSTSFPGMGPQGNKIVLHTLGVLLAAPVHSMHKRLLLGLACSIIQRRLLRHYGKAYLQDDSTGALSNASPRRDSMAALRNSKMTQQGLSPRHDLMTSLCNSKMTLSDVGPIQPVHTGQTGSCQNCIIGPAR